MQVALDLLVGDSVSSFVSSHKSLLKDLLRSCCRVVSRKIKRNLIAVRFQLSLLTHWKYFLKPFFPLLHDAFQFSTF